MRTIERGFAALIIVIIISFVLLACTVTASLTLFTLRTEELNHAQKIQSRAYAESCLDYAALRLVQDSSFNSAQGFVLTLSSGFCTIDSIGPDGPYRYIITASAGVGKTRTTLLETIDLSDKSNPYVVSFIEI